MGILATENSNSDLTKQYTMYNALVSDDEDRSNNDRLDHGDDAEGSICEDDP